MLSFVIGSSVCCAHTSGGEIFFVFETDQRFSLIWVQGIVSTTALVQSARGINIVDVKIEVVENAVSGWSLSRLDFEQTTNENSARRSASSETRTLIQTRSEQIGDLEAGKDRR